MNFQKSTYENDLVSPQAGCSTICGAACESSGDEGNEPAGTDGNAASGNKVY